MVICSVEDRACDFGAARDSLAGKRLFDQSDHNGQQCATHAAGLIISMWFSS